MGRTTSLHAFDRKHIVPSLGIAGLGALCLLDAGRAGSAIHGCLAWLTLLAVPAGILATAAGARLWPHALLVPALWCFLLVLVSLVEETQLPNPAAAMAAIGGLYSTGFALGCWWERVRLKLASLALFGSLLLTCSAQIGSLGRPGMPPAKDQPALARSLVNLSPLVFVFECAGVDWTHANPQVYAHSGVEWFPRSAYDGGLAGPGLLMLGAVLASLAERMRLRRRSDALESHLAAGGEELEPPIGD